MTDFPITPGTDTLKGTKANDTFTLNDYAHLSAGDKITGGGGNDQLVLKFNTNTETLQDSQFAGITQVQTILVDNAESHMVLGAKAGAAGIVTVDGTDANDTLEVDASAYVNKAGAGLTVIVGKNVITDLTGSAFADTFKFNAADISGGQTTIDGGAGNDTLEVSYGGGGTLHDSDLTGVSNIERLRITGDNGTVEVGLNASIAGINLVDGTGIDDGLTVNATGYARDGLTIKGADDIVGGKHATANVITGSAFSDIVQIKAGTFESSDHIDGAGEQGGKGDVIEVYGDGKTTIAVTDAAFENVIDVETLRPTGSPNATITLGENAALGGLRAVDGSAVTGTLKLDASAFVDGIDVYTNPAAVNLIGGAGADRFFFTSAGLTAKDIVTAGGSGFINDEIVITDKAVLADAAFGGLKGGFNLIVGDGSTVAADYTGAKVTLGKAADAAGIFFVENQTDYGLTVDNSGRTNTIQFHGGAGDDTLQSAPGDTFLAGAGDDTMSVKLAGFNQAAGIFSGGAGNDTLRILDSQDAKNKAGTSIDDSRFDNFSSVERLVFDGTGHQKVDLGLSADAAGIVLVDASKVAGGLELDASGITRDFSVIAGTGADTVTFGTGIFNNDLYIAAAKLTKDDHFDATASTSATLHFTDAAKLTDAFFATNTQNVFGFTLLYLDGAAAGQTFVAGANFGNFVGASKNFSLDATSELSTSSITFDFTNYAGNEVMVDGTAGNDVFIGSVNSKVHFYGERGDDTFKFSAAAFANHGVMDGNDGNDTLLLTDAGSGLFISNADFPNIGVDQIVLGASKTGFYNVQLGSDTDNSGLVTVDGSKAGVEVDIDASAAANNYTFVAGAKVNIITGGGGDDIVKIDAKTFDKDDGLNGGLGAHDTLVFTSGGVIADAGLANIQHFELIQLADAGNTIKLTDPAMQLVDGPTTIEFNGAKFAASFFVLGGKGADTIDISQTVTTTAVIVAGAGKDTLIGSDNDDNFLFRDKGDLDAGDKVSGGDGEDSVFVGAGTYSSDQFKGFKSIEEFHVLGGKGTADSTIVLKNDFFALAPADPSADGAKLFRLQIDADSTDDRIDASAVTGSLNNVSISSGSGDDTLTGGGGNDSFVFQDDGNGQFQITGDDTIKGGSGFDTIQILNSDKAAILNDSDLSGVTGVERISIDTISVDVALSIGQYAADAGISEISAENWSGKLSLIATTYDDNGRDIGLRVVASSGDNDLTLGNGDDTVVLTNSSDLDASDSIDGGDGRDSIAITGGPGLADSQLATVNHVEIVKLLGAGGTVSLDANAKAKGIDEVDASQSQAKVTVTITNDVDTTVIGSSFGDTITGGDGDDIIYGGLGRDILKGGAGDDVFVYRSAAESTDTGGATPVYDEITGFAAGDTFDFSGLTHVPTTVTSFSAVPGSGNATDYFTSKNANADVVAVYDFGNNDTDVFVDANGDGKYTAADDLMIVLKGVDATALFTGSILSDAFDATSAPFHPQLTENLPLTLLKGSYDDNALFGKAFPGDYDVVKPDSVDLSAAFTLTLGALSDIIGTRLFDWSASKGALTIDGSAREQPLYVAASTGVNTLTGGHSDDIFYFTGAALAKATVNGGGSSLGDTIYIAEKSTLVDAAFAKVSNVEILEFGQSQLPGGLPVDVSGQKVVLGVNSSKAGIVTVVNDWDTGLTVDATARTKALTFQGGSGDDVFLNAAGAINDTFLAGGGNDSLRTKLANFTGANADTFDGGLGIDEVRVLDATGAKITDADFAGFHSVERLVFDVAGKQDVTLGLGAENSGLQLVDGGKTAGLTLTVDVGYADSLSVIAGTGNDKITLGNGGGDIYVASSKFTKDDVFIGGTGILHFTDIAKLADTYFAGVKTSASGFTELDFDNAASGQSLVGGANFSAFVANSGITSVFVNEGGDFTADFTAYATGGSILFVDTDHGNDIITLDAKGLISVDTEDGNDTIKATSSAIAGGVTIAGGEDTDTLVVLDPTATIDTSKFGNIVDVEVIALAASKTGPYRVNLGAETDTTGIVKVDGSLAGADLIIDGGVAQNDLTILASAKGNAITGGEGDDTIVFDAKSFGADDTASGGTKGLDTLKFSTTGAIAAAGLANMDNIEALQLSDAGNTVAVTAAMLAQSDTSIDISVDGVVIGTFDFAVFGGKGKDTVDLSAAGTADDVAVVAGNGSDVLTGSASEDVFVFAKAGDFDKTDAVNGGADYDTVVLAAGAYAADAFKGLASIEHLLMVDDNLTSDDTSSIALDNAFFKSATLVDGLYELDVTFSAASLGTQVADFSKVTQANAVITTSFGQAEAVFHGGAESDIVQFGDDGAGNLVFEPDDLSGGLGFDTLSFSQSAGGMLFGSSFENIRGFENIALSGAGDFSAEFGSEANTVGIAQIDARNLTGDLTLDTKDFGDGLTVFAGGGKDTIDLGQHNDILVFDADAGATLTKDDHADGGGQDGLGNILRFAGDTKVDDDAFTGVSNFNRIESVDGTLDLTLDTKAAAAGFGNVDASKGLGLDLSVDAGFTGFLGVDGSAFDDTIKTGSGGGQITGHGGADEMTGGTGADEFFYANTGDSVLLSGGATDRMDEIHGFDFAGQLDTINLGNFGLAGTASLYSGPTLNALTDIVNANFFINKLGNVQLAEIGGDTYVFADTNFDGLVTFDSDLVIKVVGVAAADVIGGLSGLI